LVLKISSSIFSSGTISGLWKIMRVMSDYMSKRENCRDHSNDSVEAIAKSETDAGKTE